MICDLMLVTKCLCKAQGLLELYANSHYHTDLEMQEVDASLREMTTGLYGRSTYTWDCNLEVLEDARLHIHRIRRLMNSNWKWENSRRGP